MIMEHKVSPDILLLVMLEASYHDHNRPHSGPPKHADLFFPSFYGTLSAPDTQTAAVTISI